ncbi:hypothetical protein H7X65_02395 [Candidatus Parcubacteria bacterium]|nr:hypothetical protein [Candidatus Parcubacteria bacterium]
MLKIKDEKKIKLPKIPAKLTFEEKVSKSIGSIWSLYIHTGIFLLSFLLIILGVSTEEVLLTLTTLVSLEAIYLSIFIQMAVNKNTESLEEVEEDLGEIQEDIDEIQEGVDSIEEDIDEIQEDVEEIEEDVDEIEEGDTKREKEVNDKFTKIDNQLNLILDEIKNLRK